MSIQCDVDRDEETACVWRCTPMRKGRARATHGERSSRMALWPMKAAKRAGADGSGDTRTDRHATRHREERYDAAAARRSRRVRGSSAARRTQPMVPALALPAGHVVMAALMMARATLAGPAWRGESGIMAPRVVRTLAHLMRRHDDGRRARVRAASRRTPPLRQRAR